MEGEIIPKIYLIKGYCNTYCVDDEVKVLIDAGADYKGEVDILILTHLHPDHVFYANRIRKRTNCRILISRKDSDLNVIKEHFNEWDGKKVELFPVDSVLEEGEVIRTGAYNFKILATPGHTKGSTCLYDEKKKVLFSGDVLFADGYIGRTDFPHSEPDKMKGTLERLKKLDFKVLLPGHGRIIK